MHRSVWFPTRRSAAVVRLLLILAAAVAGAGRAGAADAPPVIRHDAVITFDVDGHTLHVVDRVQLPAAADSFQLDAGLRPLFADESASGAAAAATGLVPAAGAAPLTG